MKRVLLSIAMLFVSQGAFAHEGHDKAPGAAAAPHGGLIQGSEHLYLELVSSSDGIKIYPLDHDMKAVSVADVKLEGTATLPKKGKGVPVKFSTEKDSFAAKVAVNGAHRYTLDLTVSHKGKKEKVKFTVEPQ